MLGELRAGRTPPMALVQHISPGFDASLATWLDKGTELNVRLAEAGMVIEPGTLVVAPHDWHLEIRPSCVVDLHRGEKLKSHRPSGTVLLRSIARSFGPRGVGVVLTGMGDDGADGARELETRGGLILVQEPRTSIIDGMPRAAIERTRNPIVDRASSLGRMLDRRRAGP
jgi:two-component system chemotaxis response regulator CheB